MLVKPVVTSLCPITKENNCFYIFLTSVTYKAEDVLVNIRFGAKIFIEWIWSLHIFYYILFNSFDYLKSYNAIDPSLNAENIKF